MGRRAITMWLTAVLHLVAAPALASTLVLCVGESGHVEIETALYDPCCPPMDSAASSTQLVPLPSCSDTPLLRAIGEPRPSEQSKRFIRFGHVLNFVLIQTRLDTTPLRAMMEPPDRLFGVPNAQLILTSIVLVL